MLFTVSLSFQGEANLHEFAADAKLGSTVYRRDDSQTGQRELRKTETYLGNLGTAVVKQFLSSAERN